MGFLKGDTYNLQIIISDDNGLLNVSLVSSVEFMIGTIRKLYPNDCSYDEEKGCFTIPLTQEETFRLPNNVVEVQARVKFMSGDVKGSEISRRKVLDSISKVVL